MTCPLQRKAPLPDAEEPESKGPRLDFARVQFESVDFSGLLRQANVTVYDINPIGPGESVQGADYYQSFLTGVKDPGQTDLGDLGLQVLAVQSGGLVLLGTSDIAEMLQQCTADARTWYEIGFSEAPTEKPNEYHQIDIKIDKPGLKARTRTGYYAQP